MYSFRHTYLVTNIFLLVNDKQMFTYACMLNKKSANALDSKSEPFNMAAKLLEIMV